MRDYKWKGKEKEIEMLIEEFGFSEAAKKLKTSELLLRKACYNYKIKIPMIPSNTDYMLSENHPKIIEWQRKREKVSRSMPLGNVVGGL